MVRKNFQLPTTPKFGSPVFRVLTETEYQFRPLWKNWKMAAISLILIFQKNFQLLIPPKFGSPVFWVSTEMVYQCRPLWKNWKMTAISLSEGFRGIIFLLYWPEHGCSSLTERSHALISPMCGSTPPTLSSSSQYDIWGGGMSGPSSQWLEWGTSSVIQWWLNSLQALWFQ